MKVVHRFCLPRARKGAQAHLDSTIKRHHDAFMRTTITLDNDVNQMLRESMHRSRRSFKETLNAAIRLGLAAGRKTLAPRRFRVKARPMKLRPGTDPAGLNKLADDLEVEAFRAKARRLKVA